MQIKIKKENQIKVSESVSELFDMACDIALLTKEDSELTKKASGKLRFLWCKPDGQNKTDKQNKVNNWIDECIKNKNKANLQILLFTNPITLQGSDKSNDNNTFLSCVKRLLEAGADIRFSGTNDKFRISIHKKLIHLAVSEDAAKPVKRGINYYGESDNDGLVIYFNAKFNKAFEKAERLILDGDQIKFEQANKK